MPASTRSSASKTRSGFTRDPVPTSNQQRKRQLSNPEEKQPTTKRGKKTPGDEDDSNDDDDDDNDDDDTKGKCKEVVEDMEAPKGAKSGKRAAKAAKCVPAPFFLMILTVFDRKKALDRIREDALASAAPLPKKLPRYVPPLFFY
jgi:hypothetical protein